MMGEASLETSPKNNIIQDMINSDNIVKLAYTIDHIVSPTRNILLPSCYRFSFSLVLTQYYMLYMNGKFRL